MMFVCARRFGARDGVGGVGGVVVGGSDEFRSFLRASARSAITVSAAALWLAASTGTVDATQRSRESRSPIGATSRPGPPEPLITVVSIADQRIDVYGPRGRISGSRISSGKPGHSTPPGVFSILQRNRYHESNLYSNAPMPFMQRLTWSGIALHEGHLPGYRASHGCIRLPRAFASSLWSMGRIGMRVVVSPSSVTPVGFAHPRLPAPMKAPQPRVASLVKVAATADGIGGGENRALLPFQAAELRLAEATAAKSEAAKAVKPAYDLAQAKSAEAHRAAAALRASASILAEAEEHLALENLGMATVQTESGEAAVLARIRDAAAGVEAAREAHEKLKRIEAITSSEAFSAARAAREADEASEAANDELTLARRATSPISVFVSRQTGQVYVRQGFHEILAAPVSIAEPDRPLGTHVYTAVEEFGDAEMRWVVVSVPTSGGDTATRSASGSARPGASPSNALDRIDLPADVRQLLSERLWPGASIIVSDFGLGETGPNTDFVITTR